MSSTLPARSGRRVALALFALALLGAMAWLTTTVGNPFPPRTITVATGPPGSAFGEFGERYRDVLGRAGVEVRVVSTKGGLDNLELLRDRRSGVSVAFIESGLTTRDEAPELVSLGAVSVQPLWWFFRAGTRLQDSRSLAGQRLSIEPEGSVTRVMARRLLALNGVSESSVRLLGLQPEQAAGALLRGEIDGLVMLTSLRSPIVRRLLVADGVRLQGYPRADAYVALFPSLSKVVLPTGVADLARNIPSSDVSLLAVEANLVARRDLHPALHYLLLDAASEIHGGPEIFYKAGRFPAGGEVNLPLSRPARQFYKSGLPFVYRALPLWLAGLTERVLILLIPLLVVVLPALRFLPGLYQLMVERRIYRLYGRLKLLETEMEEAGPGPAAGHITAGLDELAKDASHLSVPLFYAQRLFILKSHIAQAQARARTAPQPASDQQPSFSSARG